MSVDKQRAREWLGGSCAAAPELPRVELSAENNSECDCPASLAALLTDVRAEERAAVVAQFMGFMEQERRSAQLATATRQGAHRAAPRCGAESRTMIFHDLQFVSETPAYKRGPARRVFECARCKAQLCQTAWNLQPEGRPVFLPIENRECPVTLREVLNANGVRVPPAPSIEHQLVATLRRVLAIFDKYGELPHGGEDMAANEAASDLLKAQLVLIAAERAYAQGEAPKTPPA